MLNHRKLAHHFGSIHLEHAFIDFAPAILDAADIEQHRRVLPERPSLDIIDELNGREVHVTVLILCYHSLVGDGRW